MVSKTVINVCSTHLSCEWPDLVVAKCQATVIMRLMAMSTGMRSATFSLWHMRVLNTPLPAPASIPVGPFRLSTHPGIGSFHEPVTLNNNKINVMDQIKTSFNILIDYSQDKKGV